MVRWMRRWASVPGVVLTCLSTIVAQSGSKPILENGHVRVTRIELEKDATLPVDTRYESITVQTGNGETQFLDPGQLAKTEPAGVGQVHYYVARSKRSVKNAGKTPVLMVQVQFLRSQGKYVTFEVPPTHYCNSGSTKACVTEQYMFCTDHFCAENVTMEPGAISTYHTHTNDYLIIATTDFTWKDEDAGKSAVDINFKAGDAKYMKAGARHRLTNVGTTTARVIMIQFK